MGGGTGTGDDRALIDGVRQYVVVYDDAADLAADRLAVSTDPELFEACRRVRAALLEVGYDVHVFPDRPPFTDVPPAPSVKGVRMPPGVWLAALRASRWLPEGMVQVPCEPCYTGGRGYDCARGECTNG